MIISNIKEEISELEKSKKDIEIRSILNQAEFSYVGLIKPIKRKGFLSEWSNSTNITLTASKYIEDSLNDEKLIYQLIVEDTR